MTSHMHFSKLLSHRLLIGPLTWTVELFLDLFIKCGLTNDAAEVSMESFLGAEEPEEH